MAAPGYDILGIGNAMVDVVAAVGESFLAQHELRRGAMMLVDAQAAERMYAAMPPGQKSSGGSVANACAWAAGFGARVAYLGKVADDSLGRVFRHEIEATGVHFPSLPLTGGEPTGRCLVAVTPDGERTMTVFLGAAIAFAETDVAVDLIADARVTYLEGYLFDPPSAQAAFRAAAEAARNAGRLVALSLSDPFCVARHRDAFRSLVAGHIDILFANEVEITSLYEASDFEAAATAAAREVELVVLTRSAAGSRILHAGETIEIAAVPTSVVDTTGAGDAYSAGFLAAYTAGEPLEACGCLGSAAAAEVIAHFGARPQADLVALRRSLG